MKFQGWKEGTEVMTSTRVGSGCQASQGFVGQGRESVFVQRAVARLLGGDAVRPELRPSSAEGTDWWNEARAEVRKALCVSVTKGRLVACGGCSWVGGPRETQMG